MKKTLLILVALITATIAFAYDAQIDGIYYNLNNSNQTAEVTYQDHTFDNYSGVTTITIPSSVTYNSETYSVTSIGWDAFSRCESLTSITIPNSVTSIGESAFRYCSSLTSITIPNGVTSIGKMAFSECKSLTSITIPNSVTSIGDEAFYYCSSLTSITIPNSVTSIGERAFSNCSRLTSITIPNSVTSIGGSVFSSCSSLTSITIPNSVTSIGDDAFRFCSSLTSITIPNSVTSIGRYAFSECKSLTSITIPNSVTSIGSSAFYDCDALTSITIPNSVTSIGGSVFSSCSSLTSITIPNSVTSIGNSAFSNCSRLTSITIPNSVTSIGNYAFYYCSSLTSITIEATTPPTLGTSVFKHTKLVAIYIPDNTLSAYKEAWGTDYIFVNSENTLTIHVETPSTLYDKIFDAGQRPAFITKLTVTGTLNDDDFTCMRETMTSLVDIDLSAITNTIGVKFNGKSNLLKILLPENLTSIGDDAFYNCRSLTSITIPNSVTSIGNYAFYNCSSLTSITIPNGVTSIGRYAFSGCSSITSITIGNSVTSIGYEAFYDCKSLTSITIPNSVTSIGYEAFYNCTSLTSITIPNSVTSIGRDAFYYCKSLTSITIPNSVTSIGERAFSNCSRLTSITIPNSVTSIGYSAFNACSRLTSITCLGSIPPSASLNDLGANTSTCTLIVPKVAYSSYLRHAYWGQFLNIETIDVDYKKLTAIANNAEWGVVKGGGYYDNGDEATLTATANSGYRFVKWSDEVTDNPRTVVVTQDSTFTAIFEANTFAITTSVNDDAMGSVTEGGEYAYGTEITLTATANSGYRFTQWSDGNTDNPRIVTVTENKTYTAEFEVAEATNVETSKISSANIYTTNSTLHIEGSTESYHILDAAGRLIYSGNATTLQLPRGIYLITMGGEVKKIEL